MLGKQIGDTIRVQAPGGDEAYEVVEVSYVDPKHPAVIQPITPIVTSS